jgi:hypothetical protein
LDHQSETGFRIPDSDLPKTTLPDNEDNRSRTSQETGPPERVPFDQRGIELVAW